ncbi:MAG: alpha/beta hydrolase [Burkholderiaceae bacterium]|nr:alpha/beta hydrolase [Burkholderiaceae bacterium]
MNDLFPGFAVHRIDTAPGVQLFARSGGDGPPLLVLHGHPQTHVIWHRVAPALARHFTLVLPDLRGYGDSGKPPGEPDHANYSKRTMAADLVALMRALGHDRYAVLAHDRGARVAHRLAMDHPQAVSRMTLLDIAPTLAMYEQTDETFARAYWHWFFLIQRAPTPERLIEASPRGWMQATMGVRGDLAVFDARALAEYERCLSQPGSAHAVCEDYRAAATIDLVHDRADRDAGRRLGTPLQVLWGERGIIARCFDALSEWRRVAHDVRGGTLPCGHYVPEEAPQALLDAALPFLTAAR